MAGVEFVPPTRKQFDYLLRAPVGGGLGHINTVDFRLRKGGGFFSALGKLARKAIPYILPAALKIGSNVVTDVAQGKDLGSSIKKRGIETLSDAIKGGRKNIRKRRRNNVKKARRVIGLKRDVFDRLSSVA